MSGLSVNAILRVTFSAGTVVETPLEELEDDEELFEPGAQAATASTTPTAEASSARCVVVDLDMESAFRASATRARKPMNRTKQASAGAVNAPGEESCGLLHSRWAEKG
jgi:hypothetical protein